MNGIRFYLEFPDVKTKKKSGKQNLGHSGNVTAVFTDTFRLQNKQWLVDCIGAVYYQKNSPCCSSSCADEYLRENCKRISEKLAREIHPNLFRCLES